MRAVTKKKIHGTTALLLYSPISPTELRAKLVAEEPCCASLAASDQLSSAGLDSEHDE